jgi:hypothetical protein
MQFLQAAFGLDALLAACQHRSVSTGGDMCNDVINQTYCLVAATLAASLQPKDHQDAVSKYRQVLTELQKDGLLTDPTESRSTHYAALRGDMRA